MVTLSLQAILLKYTVYLLRHTVKKCPQRIKDTPAVLFYRIPCIYTVYFKRLTESYILCAANGNPQRIRTPMDGRGFKQKQVCSYKLVAQK